MKKCPKCEIIMEEDRLMNQFNCLCCGYKECISDSIEGRVKTLEERVKTLEKEVDQSEESKRIAIREEINQSFIRPDYRYDRDD